MHSSVTSSRALFASAGLIAAIVFSATAVACDDDDDDLITPLPVTWITTLNGANEVPPKTVAATGSVQIVKNGAIYTYTIPYSGMTGALTAAHIHGPAAVGVNTSPIVTFNVTGAGTIGTLTGTFAGTDNGVISPDSLDKLMTSGNAYVNLHTLANVGGEIRGQLSRQP